MLQLRFVGGDGRTRLRQDDLGPNRSEIRIEYRNGLGEDVLDLTGRGSTAAPTSKRVDAPEDGGKHIMLFANTREPGRGESGLPPPISPKAPVMTPAIATPIKPMIATAIWVR